MVYCLNLKMLLKLFEMLSIAAAVFNLILVFIAFGLVILLERLFIKKWSEINWQKRVGFLLLSVAFILFLPNIAYLFTDARHIGDYCDFDFLHRCTNYPWMNLGYFVYGALGIPFFLVSIRKYSQILGKVFHRSLKYSAPVILIFLSALGVRIGLIERFNSWNILNEPLNIITTALGHVIHFDGALYSFFGLLLVLYYWSWFVLDRFSS